MGRGGYLGHLRNVSLGVPVHKVSVILSETKIFPWSFIIFLNDEKISDQLYCSKYFKRFSKKNITFRGNEMRPNFGLLVQLAVMSQDRGIYYWCYYFPTPWRPNFFFHFPTSFFFRIFYPKLPPLGGYLG